MYPFLNKKPSVYMQIEKNESNESQPSTKVFTHIFAPGFENVDFPKLLWLGEFTFIMILFYEMTLTTDQ